MFWFGFFGAFVPNFHFRTLQFLLVGAQNTKLFFASRRLVPYSYTTGKIIG